MFDNLFGRNEVPVQESLVGWKTIAFCIALITTLLFKYPNPLQYYVRKTIYFIITMTFAICFIPLSLLRPNNPKNIEWVSASLGNIFRIFGIKFELENEEYLQINQPYILLVNHQSELDFITMMNPLIWPGGACTPLAKKELLAAGPFGIACWLCGITFIDRIHPEKSRNTMNKLAHRINEENLRVWIYPEGTRSEKPQLLPFKKGGFHLAIAAQVPIVCMVSSSYQNFFSKTEGKWNSSGYVKCRVLPPFQTKGMTSDSVNQLVKLIQGKMQKEFDSLNDEIGLEDKYKAPLSESFIEENQKQNKEDMDFEHLDASDLDQNESLLSQSCVSDNNNNSVIEEESKKSK